MSNHNVHVGKNKFYVHFRKTWDTKVYCESVFACNETEAENHFNRLYKVDDFCAIYKLVNNKLVTVYDATCKF